MTGSRWKYRSGPAGRTLAGLGAGVLVAVLAGCGASSSGEITPVSGSKDTSPLSPVPSGSVKPTGPVNGPVRTTSRAGATALKIEYNNGAGTVSHWTLSCDPTGGSHPHPALACRILAAHGKQGLAPVPKGVMCPQIFSGNQTATITGTWNGTAVNASLDLRNGCETGRWRSLSGLLPNVPINGAQ